MWFGSELSSRGCFVLGAAASQVDETDGQFHAVHHEREETLSVAHCSDSDGGTGCGGDSAGLWATGSGGACVRGGEAVQ